MAPPHLPTLRAPPIRAMAGLLLVTALVVGAGIGLRDPWTPDEPRFALVAKAMVDSGDWLFPRRNGELYADKPPLFMWAIAAGYAATGSMRLAFVLPSLLAALGTVWLVADLAGRLWNRRTGLAAGLALLSTVQFVIQGRAAQVDAFLCLWTTLAFYAALRHLLLGPAWGWWAVGGAAMGLGVISKGVGFLPLLVMVPYLALRWWAGRDPIRLPGLPRIAWDWRWLAAPALLLAVVGAWLVPMLLAVQASGDPALAAYRDNILVRQTADRYLRAWHHHHAWHYYVGQAAALWLPLTALAPWALAAWWRRIRRPDPRIVLPLAWALLVLLFFSLSPGKRGVYILPALPALALAFAPLLPGLARRPDVRVAALTLVVLLAATLLGMGGATLAGLVSPAALGRALERGLPIDTLAWLAVACGAFLVILGAWLRARQGLLALVAGLGGVWFVFGLFAYAPLNASRFPAATMARIWSQVGDGELGMLRYREQFVLASERPVITFGYNRPVDDECRDALRWLAASPKRRLLVPSNRPAYRHLLADGVLAIDLGSGVGWRLIDGALAADAARGAALAASAPGVRAGADGQPVPLPSRDE